MDSFVKFKYAFHILRVGVAVTFIWIGVLILKSPEIWGAMVEPWVFNLLPSLEGAMIAVGIIDILIGFFLLVNVFVWIASALGVLHLASVIATVGIDIITVRDLGLLAASFALAVGSWPRSFKFPGQKKES